MIQKIDVEEIASVDDLHKSLKGDGRMEKAEPIHSVSHIEETEFEHPAGYDPRSPVGPTESLVGEHAKDWEGDQAIPVQDMGDNNMHGTASVVPAGSPDEVTGVGMATNPPIGYGYPATPRVEKENFMRGITIEDIEKANESIAFGQIKPKRIRNESGRITGTQERHIKQTNHGTYRITSNVRTRKTGLTHMDVHYHPKSGGDAVHVGRVKQTTGDPSHHSLHQAVSLATQHHQEVSKPKEMKKAGAGTRGGQITGYDKSGKPIYAGQKKRQQEREKESKKQRGSSREEIKARSLRREQEEKKKKLKVQEQARGGKVVGHGTGGTPIYELEGGKKYEKVRASKYGKKSMSEIQLSEENLERAFKIGPLTIGKKSPPHDPAAGARAAASGKLTPGRVTSHAVAPSKPAVVGRPPAPTRQPSTVHKPKPLPGEGAKPKFTMQELQKRKTAMKKSFTEDLGGMSAFMKSVAILAAEAGNIRKAEDLAWDTGIEDDDYQSLRTLMRSFPPRMWQFLKRVANKSIDTRVAIQHVASCIGEISKSLNADTEMRKSLGDIGDPLGAEVIDPELIPNFQEALDQAIAQAEKDAHEYRKSGCPTHAYSTGGFSGASNYNAQCNCHRRSVTKAQIAQRAFGILQNDNHDTMEMLGVDQHAVRIYAEAS